MKNLNMLIWFAGLVDGEGCFTLSIRKNHKSALKVSPMFLIQLKDGNWVKKVTRVLEELKIKYYTRNRKNQVEISVGYWKNVLPLVQALISHSIIKKPLMRKFLSHYNPRSVRNRFVPPDPKIVKKTAELVDFVRKFNKGKNRPYKWDGEKVLEFFGVKE